MATMRERQREVQLYRGQIPSPGRPTVAWGEDRVRFWAAIACGLKTEDAGVEAGVSAPVAYRWFRHPGGVNPSLPSTVTGRYLSFSDREDIAIWRAQKLGVREIARRLGRSPSTISRELRRNASKLGPFVSSTRLPPRSGMPNGVPGAKVAKVAANDQLRDYVQERLSGQVETPDGRAVGPPGPKCSGRCPNREDRCAQPKACAIEQIPAKKWVRPRPSRVSPYEIPTSKCGNPAPAPTSAPVGRTQPPPSPTEPPQVRSAAGVVSQRGPARPSSPPRPRRPG
jgi:DNA-binding CsgD family transcriptional regulator